MVVTPKQPKPRNSTEGKNTLYMQWNPTPEGLLHIVTAGSKQNSET